MSVAHLAYLTAIVLGVGCALTVGALVLTRVVRDRAEERRLRVRSSIWRVVLTLSSAEGDELDQAYSQLLAATPAQRAAVEADAFSLLPKLRGEAAQRLREVLRSWGTVDNAAHSTTSRSAVRRCRGYYRLGVLAEPGRRDQVLTGLHDRDFIGRRTAMLALGSFPDPVAVTRMVEATVEEPRLRGDFLASIDRIGSVAVPVLRGHLELAQSKGDAGERRGQLAAEALGLVGAIEAVRSLELAMKDAPDEFRIACINALGTLGSPTSIVGLGDALDHQNPDVRRAAAQALGLVGAGHAVDLLSAAIDDEDVEVARAAAQALHRCGSAGQVVLRNSPTPVAHEVLALASLGAPA